MKCSIVDSTTDTPPLVATILITSHGVKLGMIPFAMVSYIGDRLIKVRDSEIVGVFIQMTFINRLS